MWQGIKNIYHLGIAILANLCYGFPSRKLRVIGVTGTDGKTTTVSLIYHILHNAGYNVSMISSVGAIIGGKNCEVGFHVTTPSPWTLQRFIKKAVCSIARGPIAPSSHPMSSVASSLRALDGMSTPVKQANSTFGLRSSSRATPRSENAKAPRALNFLVLEATSHALDQYRVFGIKFDVGVLTNVTHEHLDYHKTYGNYVKTKAKLLKMARVAVVNRDDKSYEIISNIKNKILKIHSKNKKWITYGMERSADLNPKNFPFETKMIGEFNRYNILAAVAACKALGIRDEDIRNGIKTFKPPIGREEIVYKKDFTVMVDFAHTSNAFEQVLSSIKPSIKGRLIHVFGAAGQRDATKRPLMGKISAKYSDVIVLTAEDPRSELVDKIMREIESGIKIPNSKFQIPNKSKIQIFKIPNRQKAISAAIKMAKRGDFLLITGKSHEKSMNYGHGEVAWDEYKVVRHALKKVLSMERIKSIHFVGIKGVGMTPLAIIAKEAGMKVSGSDIGDEFITSEVLKKAGIVPLIGFSSSHLSSGSTKNGNVDMVITTGAHGGFKNIEVLEAKRRNIKVITQGEAVGIFMEGGIFKRTFTGISVTGTHGKTTTTAMIATLLNANGEDPSWIVGTGNVLSLGSPGHYGKGKYFVAEADEYMTEPTFDKTIKFMWQHPKIAIFTNIDFDHPDAYKTIEDVKDAFLKFANQLSSDSVLIACGDNEKVKEVLNSYKGKKITYGLSQDNNFVIENISSNDGKIEFNLRTKGKNLGKFKLNVFGEHNVLNATAAIIAGLEIELSVEKIKQALLTFVGTKRRSEYVGELLGGAKVYDDYAHHPAEIQSTLKGFRKNFPNYKIVCIFQPHTYSRTKSLFEQFISSFVDADTVILTKIYSSLREKPDPTVSVSDLAKKIEFNGKKTLFLPKLSDVVKYIDKQDFSEDTILITMGAGDVYKISEKLKVKSYYG